MANNSTKIHLTKDIIFKAVTILLLIVAMLPSYRSGYDLPKLAVMEMIFAFIAFPKFHNTFGRIFFPIFGYATMCFLVAYPFDVKMGFIHSFMSLWIWIFPIIMSAELIRYKSFDTNRFIYFASIVILMIIIIATLKMMIENPIVMRDMTAGLDVEFIQKMNRQNVGGFGIAYGCGAILTALVGCLLIYRLKGFAKYFAIALAVILCILVLMSQFTTLLLITGGIICCQMLFFSKSPILKLYIIAVALLLLLFSKDLLGAIINCFDGTVTATHLQEIYNSLFEDAQYDNTRRVFLSHAIDLFLYSPIWGNNVTTPANAAVIYESHCTILTILCKTGIIGLIAYLGAFWQAFKPIYKSWDKNTRKIIGNGLIAYYLLLAYLNPAENDIFSFCLGTIAILTVYYLSYNTKKYL